MPSRKKNTGKNTLNKYQLINIADVIPYDKNPRVHTPEQIKQVANSIKEFGYTNPIIIDENKRILSGHCRVEASKTLKSDKIPALIITGLSDQQKKAYTIADNQLTLASNWDINILKLEIETLDDFNIDILGFDDSFLDELFKDIDLDKPIDEDQYKENLKIVIECKSEKEQEKLYNEMTERGFKCQVQSL